jgi:hypothetical protein
MMRAVSFAAALLWAWSIAAAAQEQIYESTGKGGVPEFSGQPTPGSKEVTLPPPNVIDTDPAPAGASPREVPAGYSQLAIVVPAEQGTVQTNTGAFNVQVAVAPGLNAGHVFVVTLDGAVLPRRHRSADIAITEEDFDSSAADDAQHRLEVAVVDSSGNVIIKSGPVHFYIHRATARRSVR